ncbi:hypothetical protein AVEN_61741-1 [Araneus ventricosus]|uniref:Uncharacterized protein n=1 Tax=Araneus ventricosus TaxID=182803 RepID=A0A4Y2BIC1_ARAVE|nr:hypothetical protein AVEN_61741-1 [Araneus ventricosus]
MTLDRSEKSNLLEPHKGSRDRRSRMPLRQYKEHCEREFFALVGEELFAYITAARFVKPLGECDLGWKSSPSGVV